MSKKVKEEVKETSAFDQAQETLQTAKENLAEAKGEFRKWKKDNKIRKIEKVKDEELKEAYAEWEAKIEILTKEKEEAMEAVKAAKPKKGSGVGSSKYTYGTYTNKDGEEIKVDSKMPEGKKWRNHARKVAAKEDINPWEVEWDPSFFIPKVKAEKKSKKKDKEEAPADADTTKASTDDAPAETTEKKSRKRRKDK